MGRLELGRGGKYTLPCRLSIAVSWPLTANQEHLDELKRGVERWNRWRRESHPLPDLSEADFSGVRLGGTNLSGADLCSAKLNEADLGFADLSGAKLLQVDLTGAYLIAADLNRANLTGANLRRARLQGANFTGANLNRVKFSYAILGSTVFADLDLSQAKDLNTCRHHAPSSIGIDTLSRSQGEIPDEFLRGCGVPEQFITYARSLVGQAIEFYSSFISYSSHDEAFAERLHADLVAKTLRCWFAPEDLKIGDRFQEQIEQSIRLFDKVMIVLSAASVQSRWVEREVSAAREHEDRENRTILFPIRIDDAVMDAPQPWAAEIRRTRHISDFRRWKDHDSYQKGLERLLRDLRADAQTPTQGRGPLDSRG